LQQLAVCGMCCDCNFLFKVLNCHGWATHTFNALATVCYSNFIVLEQFTLHKTYLTNTFIFSLQLADQVLSSQTTCSIATVMLQLVSVIVEEKELYSRYQEDHTHKQERLRTVAWHQPSDDEKRATDSCFPPPSRQSEK